MTRTLSVAALCAAALAAACQTETVLQGRQAVDAAERGGRGGVGGDALPATDEPEPGSVVEVPVEAFRPVGTFLDGQGFLLGDRIEIDCSYEPFMARFVALATATGAGKYVVRVDSTEIEDKATGIHTVTLVGAAGPSHMEAYTPRVSFGGPRARPEEAPTPAPPFMLLGTEEVVVRFHLRPDPDRPVFFDARAFGTPSADNPGAGPRRCTYKKTRPPGVAEGESLRLAMELRRGADGKWRSTVRVPGAAEAETGSGR